MKIGIDTFSFHIALAAGCYDIFRTLDWLDDLGFAGLQININGPEDKFLGADHSDTDHLKRVRTAIDKKGFFVEIGGRRTSPEMLQWQLQLCADIGADTLRTLVVLKDDLTSTFDQTKRDMNAILPFAESVNVKIALENHEDITASELHQFLDTITHSHLGACVDTGNDLIVYGDPLEAAQQLASRAVSTHIKDHKLVRVGDTIHSVGVPLGTGDIDLPAILKVIAKESPLDRILLQDTTGYSSPLNKFNRADIHPTRDYAEAPTYSTEADLRTAGHHLNLNSLRPEELTKLSEQQERNIVQDIGYLRSLLVT
jgi:sugar phosphate isomerase/epimerase